MLLIVWVRHVEHPFSRRQVHDADWVIFFLWTAFVLYDATCIPETSPLPLSPQNYPLHSSEVNGFHSAPTTYNHTPTINGEGIMGKEPLKRARRKRLRHWFDGYVVRLSCFFRLTSHLTRIYFISAANRGTTAGSSGDEIGKALASVSSFLSVCCFKLVLGNKTL